MSQSGDQLTQSITKYRGDRKLKIVRSLIHVTSLPKKEQRVGGFSKRGVNISVNSKTSNLPPGIPQVRVFD